MTVVYTIGHSNHSIEHFIGLVRRHEIAGLLADVRSRPYPKWSPHFQSHPGDSIASRREHRLHVPPSLLGARPVRAPGVAATFLAVAINPDPPRTSGRPSAPAGVSDLESEHHFRSVGAGLGARTETSFPQIVQPPGFMMPGPGLEPGRPFGQGILSPLCLPVPPSRR